MVNSYVFGNKVVKQGNSLCVRIPSYIAKQAKLKQGKNVSLILEINQEFDENYSSYLFMKISRKFKKLKRYDDNKLKVFILLHFKFMKEALDKNKKAQISFFKKLRKEYSDRLVNEYFEWIRTLEKAYVFSDDGSFSIKTDYLKD